MKKIPFLENYYVTTCGEVYSTVRSKTPKKMSTENSCNYKRVYLTTPKGQKKFLVHRLVAITYIENPYNKEYVNHKDGDKLNNNVENLEWVTAKENQEHAFKTGLKTNEGTMNPRNILSEQDVKDIYNRLLDGQRNIDISRDYNIDKSTINSIKRKAIWKHLLEDMPNIKIKSRNTKLSDSKVHLICKKFEEGLTATQVFNLLDKKVKIHVIEDIKRRRCYTLISSRYNF